MKFTILLFLFHLLAHYSFGQNSVTVYGNITHPKGDKVYIHYYENYLTYAVATADSALLDKKGNFSMKFIWDSPNHATFYHGDEITNMFLCPNDNIKLTLDTKQFDETIQYVGRDSDINNYLAQKVLRFPNMHPSNYKKQETKFGYIIDSIRQSQMNFFEEYFSTITIQNLCLLSFLEMERADIDYDWANAKMSYPGLNAYFNNSRKKTDVSAGYYTFLSEIAVINPKAIQSYSYIQFLADYVNFEVEKISTHNTLHTKSQIKHQFILENLQGDLRDFIFAEWIYGVLTQENDIPKAEDLIKDYKSIMKNGIYIAVLDESLNSVARLSQGNIAPDFTLPDARGNKVSLSDFKGKNVYLDIWATWCGPCIKEIPNLENLIVEMEGKDVVFLSVSIDDDEKAWKKFIRKRKMNGVHLISSGNFSSSIAKLYNVTGIPQYYLIDKEGKIVDSNAKRPGGIKDDLNALLRR